VLCLTKGKTRRTSSLPIQGAGQKGVTDRTFERGTIPASDIGCRPIGTFQKRHERRLWIARLPHNLVRQEIFPELLIEICARRQNLFVGKTVRSGIDIRLESRKVCAASARPEAGRRDFITVGLARHFVR
jgi:hypothetical protein